MTIYVFIPLVFCCFVAVFLSSIICLNVRCCWSLSICAMPILFFLRWKKAPEKWWNRFDWNHTKHNLFFVGMKNYQPRLNVIEIWKEKKIREIFSTEEHSWWEIAGIPFDVFFSSFWLKSCWIRFRHHFFPSTCKSSSFMIILLEKLWKKSF